MKRFLATMLVLALLLAGAALAEGFAFREGVTWGMTLDEVLAAEGNPDVDIDEMDNIKHIAIEGVDYEGIETIVNYNFLDDALRMAGYMFDTEACDIATMAEALTALYGEPTDTDPATMTELMEIFWNDFVWELGSDSYYAGWQLEDGTYVGLTDDFGDIEIAYLDAEGLRALADATVGEPAPEIEEEAAA